MMKIQHLGSLLLLAALTAACVPKNQYDAVVTERNYFRNQSTQADSLAKLASLSTYDRADELQTGQADMIRRVESLMATNQALNQSYVSLQDRYNDLLTQNQSMVSESGTAVTELQQNLAERLAIVSQREAELRQAELDLQARSANAPATGAQQQAAPSQYGQVSATTPLGITQNAALTLNNVQNELAQIMAYQQRGSYVLAGAGSNRVQLTVGDALLFNNGYSIKAEGQQMLRQIATTLRDYPMAEVVVVGHADGSDGNPLSAFENSTDRAISVAQQLLNFGMIPSKVTAGGRGFNDPISNASTPESRSANRRVDLYISVR